MSYRNCDVSVLVGKVLIDIQDVGDEIRFTLDIGEKYKLHHYQNCCEQVRVEEVIGDYNDLLHNPLLIAEERSDGSVPKFLESSYVSGTWTFYEFATIKGSATIRWLGTSNGYYSERVDFTQIA